MSKKFKDEIKELIENESKIILDEYDIIFISLIKEEIKNEVKKLAEVHGKPTDLIEIKGSVKFNITELHNINKIERYFEEEEGFEVFKFNLTNLVLSSMFLLHYGELEFKFRAVL